MNISGVLVHALPEKAAAVKEAMEDLPGVEVHLQTEDGQLIVTVEESGAGDSMLAVHRVDGVISAGLVYHNFDDEDGDEITTATQVETGAHDDAIRSQA